MEFNNEEAGWIGIEKNYPTVTLHCIRNEWNWPEREEHITRILATTIVIVGLEETEKGHGFSLSSLYFKGIFSVDGVNLFSMVLETDLVSLNERSLKLIKVIASTTGHGFNLDSRKSQAWRRYQATKWLKSFVGSVGILKQPSEKDYPLGTTLERQNSFGMLMGFRRGSNFGSDGTAEAFRMFSEALRTVELNSCAT
ncbi:hypothetical protein LXL04_017257 [Taraxacum kok-saghyz]